MTQKVFRGQADLNEKRNIKQRDKIVIGVLLSVVGVILFSMISNYAKADPRTESEVISEDSGRIEDPE